MRCEMKWFSLSVLMLIAFACWAVADPVIINFSGGEGGRVKIFSGDEISGHHIKIHSFTFDDMFSLPIDAELNFAFTSSRNFLKITAGPFDLLSGCFSGLTPTGNMGLLYDLEFHATINRLLMDLLGLRKYDNSELDAMVFFETNLDLPYPPAIDHPISGSILSSSITATATPVPVPEPTSLALLGCGMLGLAGFLRGKSASRRR